MAARAPSLSVDDAPLKARIDAIYAIVFAMIAMDTLGSVMVADLIWRIDGPRSTLLWMSANGAVIAARVVMAAAYRQGRWPSMTTAMWARSLVILSALSGILWGIAAGLIIATGSDNQVMYVVCVALSGLTLSIAHVPYWPVYAVFEAPIMAAASLAFAIGERPGHWQLSGAAALLGIVMMWTSRRLARQVLQAHELATANQALVESLGQRGRELERACDALERVSRTDPLTGLANRRSRDDRLADEWARAVRSGGSLAVVAIDVDRFKRFNDTHGHAAGDQALRAVAEMLQSGIRSPIDLAARQGGEEFMLILPGVDLAGATSIAERVRVLVAHCHDDPAFDLPEKVTISLGVAAMHPAAARSVHELTIAADAALYQAKLGGRNRYEVGVVATTNAA
ncbi:MAG: GGDEF domain-containing protein [Sphingomonas sp.]|uniref:GGDEF domain-containing protein n=1 Tax=Sphingomonas sp. TaxID=28214 RepID=UPI001ACD2EF8|nr:GGDEF domain-containing protein [Sphingomonas sp.]MBN8807187.1 GGDEF domain-containing protein [Sphingomonas sp.]